MSLSVGEDVPPRLGGLEGLGLRWRRLAVLTASDPLGRWLDHESNLERHRGLERQVERSGRRFLPARVRDPGGESPLGHSLAVVDPTDQQLDDWMLGFGQEVAVVADRQVGVELREHPHEEGRVAEDPVAAERSAVRCWCAAWRERDLASLRRFMHPDVVLKSTWTTEPGIGEAAVMDWLHCWDRVRAVRDEQWLPGMHAGSGAVSIGATGRPCAVLSGRANGQASAVVLLSLDRGQVVQVRIEPPSRLPLIWSVPNIAD